MPVLIKPRSYPRPISFLLKSRHHRPARCRAGRVYVPQSVSDEVSAFLTTNKAKHKAIAPLPAIRATAKLFGSTGICQPPSGSGFWLCQLRPCPTFRKCHTVPLRFCVSCSDFEVFDIPSGTIDPLLRLTVKVYSAGMLYDGTFKAHYQMPADGRTAAPQLIDIQRVK